MNRKVGNIMVVGAGISGIRSALDLAQAGYGVTLIDQSPHLGGILSQLDYQFPSDRCGMCKMLPMVDRDASSQYCLRKGLFHENIDILLSTQIISIEGEPGKFEVTLKQEPEWVLSEQCTGCGLCETVCPVTIPDTFNEGLSTRKAIHLAIPHAIPAPFVIDQTACTLCGECEKICPTGAIRLSGQARKQFRILVVDDELIVRDSIRESLLEDGFEVDMAESGKEALEMLKKSAYELMLLDIKMPGMDGVEVLKKAKEIQPHLTVVMMTAYATVETAVEAMKIGAGEYLIKPFEEDALSPMVMKVYEEFEMARARKIEVGAVILNGGTRFFNPADGKNTYGYGVFPNVVTGIEFERIMSGTGPSRGDLIRPMDGKPLRKVAWIQCVGSRDLQTGSDFCSGICCMAAIKEALVAKEKTSGELDATIFYMDMRTFGKSFQRYRERAEEKHHVHFTRGRVHSLLETPQNSDIAMRYTNIAGKLHNDTFDMVVLSVGQQPAASKNLAEIAGISLNSSGFMEQEPFSLSKTPREGIFTGGSFSCLSDIGDSLIRASSAALSASRVVHASGGGLSLEASEAVEFHDVSRERPEIMVIVCLCGQDHQDLLDPHLIENALRTDPSVVQVTFLDKICTETGWQQLTNCVKNDPPNRLLIGACLPYGYARRTKALGKLTGLDPTLMEVVDIGITGPAATSQKPEDNTYLMDSLLSSLRTGIARLRYAEPSPVPTVPITPAALIVGAGISGMHAALAIADHGYEVHIIEKNQETGGNLKWLGKTLEGHAIEPLLSETRLTIEKHPKIHLHTKTGVVGSSGNVGYFSTLVANDENSVETIDHGVTIIATGGNEAETDQYGHGTDPAIVTQRELEQKLAEGAIEPDKLDSVVMIQCVGSREEPRNYCSRICCSATLKQALYLKEKNRDINIYVLYRDIMAYGGAEAFFTRARKAGVIFIQYDPAHKPEVNTEKSLEVMAMDPILDRKIAIDADLVVLATGIVPALSSELAGFLGVDRDQDGFFSEAESKWRPVDAMKEGVFACGLSHSPRSVTESMATAEAAAQRCLTILSQKRLPAGKIVATIHPALCSLCQKCIDACPYGARELDITEEAISINAAMCQGCGSCATVCPNGASVVEGFRKQQMLEVIDAAFV
jgi:heterodisulfide reductase subunit A2